MPIFFDRRSDLKKNVRTPIEIILHIVLKFQIDRAY